MQVIFKNETKRSNSSEADLVNSIIYVGRIGRCLKGKHFERLRSRATEI